MGPVDPRPRARGTGVPYAVKIHGSALEYTVKPLPALHARTRARASRGARGILVGSRHTAESLWAAMDDPDAAARARGSARPASTSARFAPREPAAAAARACERLRARARGGRRRRPDAGSSFARATARGRRRAGGALDPARPARGLRRQADRLQGRRAAAGRLAARARARAATRGCSIVGFGAFRGGARGPRARRSARGDLDAARALRARGRRASCRSSARSSTRSGPRRARLPRRRAPA